MSDLFTRADPDPAAINPATPVPADAPSGVFTLTDEQRRAVEHEGGPLIVLAGPGTGKTRVITTRVAHMVLNRGVEPDRIVAVTFTNKAAGELGERLGEMIDSTAAARITASTFHSLGLGIIRRFGDVLGLPSNPTLIDSSQRKGLIREIIRDKRLYRHALGRGIDSAADHAHAVMESLRNHGLDAAAGADLADTRRGQADALDGTDREAMLEELERYAQGIAVYTEFETRCRDRGWLVFDDLIMLPAKLMREHPGIASMLRHDHKHVVVDEFQDVNAAQIEMIRQLCPPESNPDLCVVGDDDQSIYGFRGADDRAFARFAQTWRGCRTIELTTNFRSANAVVVAGNEVIRRANERFAPDKRAVAHKGVVDGSAVELIRLEDDAQAGEAIASMLLKMVGEGVALGSCAVIARTNPELERIARVLTLEGIPIEMRERRAPMDDEGAQDVLAWIRLLVDPGSTADVRRVLCRPPYGCEAMNLGSVISAYRVQRSRHASGDPEAADPGPLLDWLAARADERAQGKINTMRELAGELGKTAAEVPAADALLEIIKRTGVVHRELGDARDRARRIEALAAMVRFARTRADRFDQPGDLGAMLRYWDDLDDSERSLGELPEDRVANSGGVDGSGGEGRGAVAMLTAHASKGLEFDTVFIPRVSGPHGYPKSGRNDGEVVPEGLLDPGDDPRSDRQRGFDEERRVFYVALTRAERRAVLLAKVPKKASSVNFACELRDALGPDLIERDAGDVLDPAVAGDAVSRLGAEFKAASRVRDVFDQARRDARRDAAEAIDAMELGEIDRTQMGLRLSRAADRIAAVNEVYRSGEIPAWITDDTTRGFAARLVDALAQQPVEDDGSIYPPIAGPLKLSFTQISRYLHCPACYLVEHVLRLPRDDAMPAVVGTAMHEALERFYTQWRDDDAEGRPTPGVERLDELVVKHFHQHWPRDVEIDTDRLEQARAMARVLWDRLHRPDAHIEEIEKTITLPYECDGVTHTIRAVLDRVDATESGGRRVIDYKTGGPRKDLTEPDKRDLQLGIYAMALNHELGDAGPGSVCEYWVLQEGTRGSIGFDALDMEKIREKIDTAIRGMLSGDWKRSRRCDEHSSCAFLATADADTLAAADSSWGK